MSGRYAISKDEYHDDHSRLSHSSMEVFRKSVPLYHGTYVTGKIPKRKPTEAMAMGTAFHTLLLEPERFSEEVFVMEQTLDLRTKVGKEVMETIKKAYPGKMLMDPEDYLQIQEMRDAVMGNPVAAALVDSMGEVELALQWDCADTEVPCKVRLDKFCQTRNGPRILDVKTASDPLPDAFMRSAVNFGYHRQRFWYEWGVHEALGEQAPFLLLAIGKDPPYESIVYELDEASYELAARQVRADLNRLRDCRLFDEWSSQYAGEVQKGVLPRYAYHDT